MASVDDNSSLIGSDSEDDIDWEEVDVPQNVQQQQNLEITIQARPRQKQDKTDKCVCSRDTRFGADTRNALSGKKASLMLSVLFE